MRPFRVAPLVAMLAIVSAVAGCEKPFDRTPVGFKEACYGEDPQRNWVCSEQRWVAKFSAGESDWPAIKSMVQAVGAARSLEIFDVSSNHPGYIRTAEIYACSASGVMLFFDKRIYDRPEMNRDGDEVRIELRTWRNAYDWRTLANHLEAELKAKWPQPVEIETPGPLGNARALPDAVPDCNEQES